LARQQIQTSNEKLTAEYEQLTAETLRLQALCSDKDAELERSLGISAAEEVIICIYTYLYAYMFMHALLVNLMK
jgi:hypothetical protein